MKNDTLAELIKESTSNPTTQIYVDEQSGIIEIMLEPDAAHRADWIRGSRADVRLYRAIDDGRVVGVIAQRP